MTDRPEIYAGHRSRGEAQRCRLQPGEGAEPSWWRIGGAVLVLLAVTAFLGWCGTF